MRLHRRLLPLLAIVLFVLPALAAPAIAAGKGTAPPRMYDLRVGQPAELQKALAGNTESGQRMPLSQADREVRAAQLRQGLAQLQATAPGAKVKVAASTGGAERVIAGRQPLTAAAPGARSEDIVRGFLAANAGLYGLSAADLADFVVLGDSPGGRSGLRMLRMEQVVGGRPIFQSETRFLLDRDGRLVRTLGNIVPNARAQAPALDASELLSASDAVVRLLGSVGKATDASAFAVSGSPRPGWFDLAESDAHAAGPVTAREVLFPLAPGVLVPAWSLVVFTEGEQDWYAMVDAQTGDVLWRKNIRHHVSAHDARFRVYVQADGITPADSPAPQTPTTMNPGDGTQYPEIAPTIVSMHTAMDATASPNGWIDDCPAGICGTTSADVSTEKTVGNNVRACMDRTVGANNNICDTDAASMLDGFGMPTGNPDTNGRNRDFLGLAPRDFQTGYLPPPQGGNPEAGQTATGTGAAFDQFRRGSVTQQFYVSNWYHDELFNYGFDEAHANFQQTNFTINGLGGDRVLVDVQDGFSTNNANFATPPDGVSGRAQMFRFTGPTIDRDGGLDTVILIHELTHGTSNRMVGNAAGLNWDIAGSMGEGWSDFYGLAMINNTAADLPGGRYGAGAYATYKLIGLPFLDNYLYAIRRFPYSTDNTVNPMTWADVDDVTHNLSGGVPPDPTGLFQGNGGMEVHNAGELWALSLWEVRERIINDPAGANGNVAAGNTTSLQLVTDGLAMTPVDPSFLDARDALFDADCAANACANEESIWGGFADRGLGYGAVEPYYASVHFAVSHLSIGESFNSPYLDVVNPPADVAVNDSASNNNGDIDPGESVLLTITLTNPWRAAGKAVASATATLTTTTTGITIWDNTAAWGAIAPQGTGASLDTFLISVAPSVLCGSAIDFTLTVTSSLGTTADTFKVRIGNANGTDPVVTYTDNPALPVTDDAPRGVFDQMNVTDDFVIADLDLRIDSLPHTFVDDLTLMLRSPNGIGVDHIGLIGFDSIDGGSGDNLTNTVIDDDQPADAAHDMILATSAANSPGYDGPWVPVYNSSDWPVIFGQPADPIGNLTHYNGLSTQGTWSLHAADEFAADTGTLNTWSILVTPVNFDCTAFGGTVTLAATKTVSGTFTVGGTITYTVTLTNTGTAGQGDNAGDEFTDTLPASLTLVSVIASSGTPGMAGNTATWNGTLAPLGGSVTITITATINAAGQICNQGTANYDANGDGTNDTAAQTDDPSVGGAADPTCFTVGAPSLSATKTVTGTFAEGGAITYTIVITNSGAVASPDNAGNELTDTLPASVTVGTPTATSGTVSGPGVNPVTWNGSVPAAGSVTITIPATINPGTAGQTISNQGTVSYDADLNGSNETTVQTDDPGDPAPGDSTDFVVALGGFNPEIPTLSQLGALMLALGLAGLGLLALRRRS